MAAVGDESAPDADDVRFAITQFSFWIANADVKAGLVATATTLVTTALVSQKKQILLMFPLKSVFAWISFVALTLGVVSIVATVVGLVRTLRPRRAAADFSRYSWVSVSGVSANRLSQLAQPATDRDEALLSAGVLARIVATKVNALSFAALMWVISVGFLLVWYLFLPA